MIRGILFDLDGVLYNDNRLIPGAVEAVAWVRAQAIPHLFVTNTTSRSRAVLVEKLGGYGIPAAEAEIHTPAAVASQWLRAHGQGDIALFLRPSTRSEFAGLPCLPDDAERGASYVVIGDLEDLWDYRTLNRAFRLLHHNPEAKLIALGMTRYWMASDGLALGRRAVCRRPGTRHRPQAPGIRQARRSILSGRCREARPSRRVCPHDRR